MRKIYSFIMPAALVLSIIISNVCSIAGSGARLDELRNSVLRLHILANSDSDCDQQLKLNVRDAVLEQCGEIFNGADSMEEAEKRASEQLEFIEDIARKTLSENGCSADVNAEITRMYFDERVYGDITMPAGEYTSLRIKIGEAKGHNWWCVMYPPLCIPSACDEQVSDNKDAEDEFFSDDQKDIIYNPDKYKIKFAIWDKIKSWME